MASSPASREQTLGIIPPATFALNIRADAIPLDRDQWLSSILN
jgi:hypothetical protein